MFQVFTDFDGKPVDTREQKDAAEFLGILFDKIETKLKTLPESGPLSELRSLLKAITVQVSFVTKCEECGNRSERSEPSQTLAVEVGGAALQGKHTLEQVKTYLLMIWPLVITLLFLF